MHADRDQLDRLIDQSVPETAPVDDDVQASLAAMARAARTAARRRLPRRSRRVATGIAVAVLVSGGAGTAAALAPPGWVPWTDHSDRSVSFHLPSGATCEFVLSRVTSNDPALTKAAEQFLARADLMDLVDVDGALRANRGSADDTRNQHGQKVSRNKDSEFHLAVTSAVFKAVNDEMERQGWDVIDNDDLGLDFEGQSECPGAAW